MGQGLASIYLDTDHAHNAIERFLSSRPAHSTRTYVDRVFARTLEADLAEPKEELALLLLQHPRFTAGIELALSTGALASHLTSAIQLLWLLRRHRLSSRGLSAVLQPHLEAGFEAAAAWQEPFRSELFHWAEVTGLFSEPAPIARPLDPVMGAHFDLSQLLYQTMYGMRTVLKEELEPSLSRLRGALRTDLVSAELLAGALIVERALVPQDPSQMRWVLAKLLSRQTIDGGFAVRRPDLVTEHQTACAALVGLSYLRA